MKCLILPFVCVILCAPAVVFASEDAHADSAAEERSQESEKVDPNFARYETIIKRMPFGEPPPGFDPLTPGAAASNGRGGPGGGAAGDGTMTEEQRTEEEQKLAASVRVSVLNVTPSGKPMIGFTDNSDPKVPRHYYLEKGQVRDGWTVKDIVPEERSVTLEREGIEVTLKLGEQSSGKGGAKGAAPSGRMGHTPQAQQARSRGGVPAAAGGGGLAALRMRRTQQMAQNKAREAERAAAEATAKKEREEEKAREAEERARQQQELQEERQRQREQLQQIQEELKRAREARQEKEKARENEEASAEEG